LKAEPVRRYLISAPVAQAGRRTDVQDKGQQMKAVVMDRAGGPEVLQCVELPDSAAAPGQVLVKVAAAAVNFMDIDFLFAHPERHLVEALGQPHLSCRLAFITRRSLAPAANSVYLRIFHGK
jgi:hypothetical protein